MFNYLNKQKNLNQEFDFKIYKIMLDKLEAIF